MTPLPPEAPKTAGLLERYREVRARSEALAAPLSPEDQTVQSMPDVSPTKWHLAHVSWFFETFLLGPHLPGYRPFHPSFEYLFNSYYNAVGEQYPRPRRGLITRPGVEEVRAYRPHVDRSMAELLEKEAGGSEGLRQVTELGLNHEEQHQELLLMDIKHVLSRNPLRPAYRQGLAFDDREAPALEWIEGPGGLHEIGHRGEGFAFDNEGPPHQVFLRPFALASRLVTNGEYRTFVEDGGYGRPELWLSDGWSLIQAENWDAPLYWERGEEGWREFTLAGLQPLDENTPVCHLSYYEADAYATWADERLATEAEWEVAAREAGPEGTFLESGRLHPAPAAAGAGAGQMLGDLWEWTQSPYTAYPGYRPPEGALGEYNGKFMCNQLVLRGGACVTPRAHLRSTYRNFYYPHQRWPFTGLRLARDLGGARVGGRE